MTRDKRTARFRYEEVREAAILALFDGRLAEAVRGLERAAGIARTTGDADLIAIALANLALAAIESGTSPPAPALLREAFGRSREPTSRFFCAWSLSKLYLESHDARKATFYAHVAYQLAPRQYLACAEQSLGIILLARGDCRRALAHLRRALEDWPLDKAPIALSSSALAYLWSLMGDRREAGRAIETTLAHLGDLDGGYPACYRHEVHLSLGFSLLELEEPERAFHHAERALEALDGIDQRPRHEHKMALYLAAHAALDAGSADAGSHYADQLQGTYYPGLAGIRDLLVAVRTCGMVNWLA